MNDKPCVKCGGKEKYEDGVCKQCVNNAYDELGWRGAKKTRNAERLATARRTLNKGINNTCAPDELLDILGVFAPVAAKHRAENCEKAKARHTKWRRENPGKTSGYTARRRARKLNAEGVHTADEWLAILDHYGNACLACGSTENIHKDHIVALANGGSNWASNLQPLCQSCNSSKGTNTVDYRPTLEATR